MRYFHKFGWSFLLRAFRKGAAISRHNRCTIWGTHSNPVGYEEEVLRTRHDLTEKLLIDTDGGSINVIVALSPRPGRLLKLNDLFDTPHAHAIELHCVPAN